MQRFLGGAQVVDTFAEAFGMRCARLVVTAADEHWLRAAAHAFCGYGTSVIGCDAECGIEHFLPPAATPDARPGVKLLAFTMGESQLATAVQNRAAQCLLTCPTTAVFDGMPESETRVPLGKQLRYFGDGYQKSKRIGEQRYWRVPVMDGEFVVAESLGIARGIAGGNLVFQAVTQEEVLAAGRRAVEACRDLPDVITPFPGGLARSGSKVGSQYPGMVASTAESFCPTLRGRVKSQLHPGANAAVELVLDGIDATAISTAMRAAMRAASDGPLLAIAAGNYGGKLGKHHFHLHSLLQD